MREAPDVIRQGPHVVLGLQSQGRLPSRGHLAGGASPTAGEPFEKGSPDPPKLFDAAGAYQVKVFFSPNREG